MATMTFDRLIAPVDRDRFLLEFWTRKAVHLEDAGRTFDDVFGWGALNEVLSARDLTFPKIKVSRNDQPVAAETFTTDGLVDVQAVLALFREGASVGITGADSDWSPLRAVVEGVYDALLESVHTNVYCSPPNTQGFHCHFDLHEVFVLQVEGTKHWRVFAPTIEAPIESWHAKDAPDATAKPYLDVVLRKGDVLYVPRGHWHYAVAQDTTSIHVTVGVTCHKGAAFMDWLSREAMADPVWRQNMPAVAAAVSDGAFELPSEWTAWIDALKRSLANTLADPDIAEKFCKTMLRSVRPIGGVEVAIQTAPAMDIEALVFERPMGRRHFLQQDDESVTLTSADCDIELEPADAGFLVKIFSADTFTADDIRRWRPDADLPEVAELLGELVRSGLLTARPR
jgi:ribosomal protein L16 Arg81 hydroxylase